MREKVVAHISIEKNGIKIIRRSQPDTLNIFSIDTLKGEQLFLEVFDDRQKTLFKMPLKSLFAIHKKFIKEGKVSFEFREQKFEKETSRYACSTHDVVIVFIQQAHPQNIITLVNKLIAYLQTRNKKSPTSTTAVVKRDEAKFLEHEDQTRERMAVKPLLIRAQEVTSKSIARHAFREVDIAHVIIFLDIESKIKLSQTCHHYKKCTDAFVFSLSIRTRPPQSIFYKLLERFQNITELTIESQHLLKRPLEYKCRILSKLARLDVTKSQNIHDDTLHQLLSINKKLEKVCVSCSSLKFSHFCKIIAFRERLKVFKIYGPLESVVNFKSMTEFLSDNNFLNVLKINSIVSRSFTAEHLPKNLKKLTIECFYSESNSSKDLLSVIEANKELVSLNIKNFYFKNKCFILNVSEDRELARTFGNLQHLKNLTIGTFFSPSTLNALGTSLLIKNIALRKLHISNMSISDEDFQNFIKSLKSIEIIDISESNLSVWSLAGIDESFYDLNRIVIRCSDLEAQSLRGFLNDKRLKKVKIIRKVESVR